MSSREWEYYTLSQSCLDRPLVCPSYEPVHGLIADGLESGSFMGWRRLPRIAPTVTPSPLPRLVRLGNECGRNGILASPV